MRKKLVIWLPVLLLQAVHYLNAQVPDLPVTHDSLYSEILKEKRSLEIILPAGYNPQSNEKYDVLYVTDGEWNTRIVSNIQLGLAIQFIPPCIVVSIPNVYPNNINQRGRDFTPTHLNGQAQSGGAASFLAFLKTELLPYVSNKYKTNGENTYYGSSLAGLFGMYALCKEPQLFQSWLLADPAFWWDNNYIYTLLKENIEKIKALPETLLITAREGAPFQFMGIAGIDSILRAAAFTNVHYRLLQYNDETHNSMIFRTVYDGLKFTYAGYSKEDMVFHPMQGILLKDKPLKINYSNDLSKNLRYTTDGADPSDASALITGDTVIIHAPAQLKIKSLSNRERYSKTTTGIFKAGNAFAATNRPKNVQPGGWQYTYYEGVWDSLPDFKRLQPLQSGMAGKDFDIAKLPRQKNFSCLLEGQLEIKTDGYYIFGIDVDGGARLLLGNQVLINYNGLHTSGKFQSFVLPLVKGFYPMRLEYFQKEGIPSLNLVYITPNSDDPVSIPLELEYSPVKKD